MNRKMKQRRLRLNKLAQLMGTGVLAGSAFLLTVSVEDNSFTVGLVPAAYAQDDEEEGRRPPPTTRSANTLSRAVYTRIEKVQEFRDAEQYQEALAELAEIKDLEARDRLNNYEKYMMNVFYASISLDMDREEEALGYFEQALAVPELTPDQQGQVYRSLGSLYFSQERYQESIDTLRDYLEIAEDPSESIFLQIAYAYYQLEQYEDSIPWVRRNMDAVRASGEAVPKNTYDLLKSIYLILEDFPNARQLTREVIVLFDGKEDWAQYAQIDSALDNVENSAYTLYVAKQKNYLDTEAKLISLAYQMYGNDNPFGAAQLIEEGMASGIIEGTADNYDFLSLCYQLAREDRKAVEPTLKAIELNPEGDLHMRLGQIYYNLEEYENAIAAYQRALDSGDVEREDQLLLRMASTNTFLDRYDAAIDAARRAGRANRDSADIAQRYISNFERQKARYERLQRERRELAGFFE